MRGSGKQSSLRGLAALAIVATVSGCSNGRRDTDPVRAPVAGGTLVPPAAAPPTGPLCTGVAPAPGAVAPAIAPSVATGAGGTGGTAGSGSIAVVILMLPDGKNDPLHASEPRTYKLSLTANSETATIEVDGQEVGSARVQHVLPEERVRRTARPAIARPTSGETSSPPSRDADSRPWRPSAPSELSFAHRPPILSPNGAPIID